MNLHLALKSDTKTIETIYRRAFESNEWQAVANLAVDLLSISSALSLVAELDNQLVGHVSFSPVFVRGHDSCRASILAPLAVNPAHQNQRVGTRLVEHGIRLLSEDGIHAVLVYGDPAYYGRFGFSADAGAGFIAPYPLTYPFGWQALILDGSTLPELPVQIDCVDALSHAELW